MLVLTIAALTDKIYRKYKYIATINVTPRLCIVRRTKGLLTSEYIMFSQVYASAIHRAIERAG